MYTVATLATITAATQNGCAPTSTAPTCVQSVPLVAKYRQASETAMPAIRRSALRRGSSRASDRAALSLAFRRDESVFSVRAAAQIEEPRAPRHGAGRQEQPREPLPVGIEPEAEPQ